MYKHIHTMTYCCDVQYNNNIYNNTQYNHTNANNAKTSEKNNEK